MKKTALAFLAALPFHGGAAGAAEWTLGLGVSDYSTSVQALNLALEARSEPVTYVLGAEIAPQAGVTLNTRGATYIGIGASATSWFGTVWFVEGSLMGGYYNASDDRTDLGSDIEFRSLIGLGREFGEVGRVSVGLSHLSNAGLDDVNPGVNTVSLRLTRDF